MKCGDMSNFIPLLCMEVTSSVLGMIQILNKEIHILRNQDDTRGYWSSSKSMLTCCPEPLCRLYLGGMCEVNRAPTHSSLKYACCHCPEH